ncbi:MAG TPA: M23 family metallopeptidase [Burkholderiaceae bacterium]|nr:M23 family metallopeptidase [Burkholderiaceae bacterium]
MQIIFVDRRLSRARTISVSKRQVLIALVGSVLGLLFLSAALNWLTLRMATELRIPLVSQALSLLVRDDVARNEQFLRDNVSTMARKLGEMQAQLMRLDALGERVSKLAGIRPEEFNFKELPGRGGTAGAGRMASLDELHTDLERVAKGVSARADYLDVVESELLATQMRSALLPSNAPVVAGFVGSPFGMRADPFTGNMTMHAGVDFAAPVGTPIYSAAGGVVVGAEVHPVFGRLIEIDHGNDLKTLYAHASKIDVKLGELVKRGQKIGEVGSSGRSTGPHLHFEVHSKGAAQNPSRFLAKQKPGSPLAPLGTTSAAGTKAESGAKVDGARLAAGAAASK